MDTSLKLFIEGRAVLTTDNGIHPPSSICPYPFNSDIFESQRSKITGQTFSLNFLYLNTDSIQTAKTVRQIFNCEVSGIIYLEALTTHSYHNIPSVYVGNLFLTCPPFIRDEILTNNVSIDYALLSGNSDENPNGTGFHFMLGDVIRFYDIYDSVVSSDTYWYITFQHFLKCVQRRNYKTDNNVVPNVGYNLLNNKNFLTNTLLYYNTINTWLHQLRYIFTLRNAKLREQHRYLEVREMQWLFLFVGQRFKKKYLQWMYRYFKMYS